MDAFDPTAWSAALLGLFCIAVAIGALRQPGLWRQMVDEIDGSPALQLISGFCELSVGAAIFLLNPWIQGDLLAMIVKTIGGLMMAEALVVMAMSDIYFHFWLKNLAALHRLWPLFTLMAGLALATAGMIRLA
ncbi:hypothetical protein [Erythrobacter aureus]|uniref:Uncharacterized protein n=1 Tax=Erythrobacter aureus TaxID=2182384 RepID=A0A345YCW9_9SPHN|nr:hypothetical protein [Erythrobacter aureus]AXK41771.1 hypothetical protein DVR09_04960 [Erythrobacter aureus]